MILKLVIRFIRKFSQFNFRFRTDLIRFINRRKGQYVWFIFNCAYIARIEDGVKKTMKNTSIMMLMNLPWAALIFVIVCAAFVAIAFVPISALFIPTGVMYFYDLIILKVFNKYINMDDEEKIEKVDDDEVVMHDIKE